MDIKSISNDAIYKEYGVNVKRKAHHSDSESESDSDSDSEILIGLKEGQSVLHIPDIVNRRDKVQREDGMPWGKQDPQNSGFNSDWISEQNTRRILLEQHPDYKFIEQVAGFCHVTAESFFVTEDLDAAVRRQQALLTQQRIKQSSVDIPLKTLEEKANNVQADINRLINEIFFLNTMKSRTAMLNLEFIIPLKESYDLNVEISVIENRIKVIRYYLELYKAINVNSSILEKGYEAIRNKDVSDAYSLIKQEAEEYIDHMESGMFDIDSNSNNSSNLKSYLEKLKNKNLKRDAVNEVYVAMLVSITTEYIELEDNALYESYKSDNATTIDKKLITLRKVLSSLESSLKGKRIERKDARVAVAASFVEFIYAFGYPEIFKNLKELRYDSSDPDKNEKEKVLLDSIDGYTKNLGYDPTKEGDDNFNHPIYGNPVHWGLVNDITAEVAEIAIFVAFGIAFKQGNNVDWGIYGINESEFLDFIFKFISSKQKIPLTSIASPTLKQELEILLKETPTTLSVKPAVHSYIQAFSIHSDFIAHRLTKLEMEKQESMKQLQELKSRINEILVGKVDIKEVEFPYKHRREWAELPENSGFVRIKPIIVSSISSIYNELKERLKVTWDMEKLQSNQRTSDLFAQLVANNVREIQIGFPKQYYGKDARKENMLKKKTLLQRFKRLWASIKK